jgi:class 3 adenylate cyclase/tetratricopeptide (TPR) repeat protein
VSGAQRRQVTVLFCDLANSAELAARVDPEDMRDVLHAYLNAFAARIEAMGGFIARYMGDGVMAYFGYPLAREGDPARAVRAALDVIAVAKNLAPHGHRLSVRCGVATGLSVIGDLIGRGMSSERGVIGAAPNLASRLQSAAAPDEALICATTARMTDGLFETRDLGALSLKGFATPERGFVVLGARSAVSRLPARGRRSGGPMIGRDRESARLAAAWRQAMDGRMACVSLVGEAGIGKSRLIAEFQETLSDTPHTWLQAGGDPMLEGQAYGLVSRLVRARLGADADLTPAGLAPRLERAGLVGERAALLARAVSGSYSADAGGPSAFDPEDLRRGLSKTLIEWVVARARAIPAVVVVEDLHWVDPSSLELLQALVVSRPDAPLLIITSARPEFRALRFEIAPRLVPLERLSDVDIGKVAANAADGPIPQAQLASLVARADGNPLFAEELAAHLTNDPRRAGSLPDTLVGLLTARLDATGEGAPLASAAAAIGRTFDAALLAKVARMPLRDVRRRLGILMSAGLVSADGDHFQFRHALIREAAYEALIKEDRRALHRRAALALTRTKSEQEIAIARHWREAGEPRRAADTYRDLGRRYVGARAYGEAAQAYRAGLEVLGELPNSPARDREDMELSSALANALQITDGYAAAAPSAAAARARALAERLGDSDRMFTQLSAEWMAASSSGDYALARELVARAMPLAEAGGVPETLGTAHMMQMTSAYRVGALVEGEAAFRAGEAYFRHPTFQRRPGAVPQTFGNGAFLAWLLGHEAAARKRIARVVTLAARAKQPYVRAFAGYMAALQFMLMDDAGRAATFARDAVALSDANGFPQFSAAGRAVLGRALAVSGQRRAGLALMRDGLDRMGVNGSSNGMTMYLTWLAQSYVEARDKPAAREVVARALKLNPAERFFRGETLRVGAEALPAGSRAEAVAELTEAIDLARAMKSVWQEKRARASLDRISRRS